MTQFLSIHWDVNPELFTIGVFRIGYYNILFVLGFITGYYIMRWFFRREQLPVKMVESLTYTIFFSAAIGARLGHCLFYDPVDYLSHPIEILKIWKGGLASHGGGIGLLFGAWLFVRKYRPQYGIGYMWLLDRCAIPTALAGCFIRIGNLMNSEIYGVETSLPWGFIFARRGETMPMHPTQIYEALSYLLIFFFLMWLYKKFLPKLKTGMLLGIFWILLFTARFLIEFIKNTQVSFEQKMTLDMGQWLSIPFILLGIGVLIYSYTKGKPAMRPVSSPVVHHPAPVPKPANANVLHKDGNRLGKKRRG